VRLFGFKSLSLRLSGFRKVSEKFHEKRGLGFIYTYFFKLKLLDLYKSILKKAGNMIENFFKVIYC